MRYEVHQILSRKRDATFYFARKWGHSEFLGAEGWIRYGNRDILNCYEQTLNLRVKKIIMSLFICSAPTRRRAPSLQSALGRQLSRCESCPHHRRRASSPLGPSREAHPPEA